MDYTNLTEAERHELNIAWLPRLTVPNVDGYIEGGARRSAEVRERLNCYLNIPYGDTPRQVLDIYPAAVPGAPVFFFIHGGYWRAFDKGQYSEVVEPVVTAGATAVTLSYDLCPNVSISTIVDQVRKALIWTYDNVAEYNGDPAHIHVCGHSAGGHLTGMMMATDWEALRGLSKNFLRGAIPISGVFDIEPHMHTDLQGDLKLTAAVVVANSPLNLPLHFDAPVICAVGGVESEDFRNQSKDFVDKCKEHNLDCEYFELDGDNHFDVTDRLADPSHPLTRAVLAQMGLS